VRSLQENWRKTRSIRHSEDYVEFQVFYTNPENQFPLIKEITEFLYSEYNTVQGKESALTLPLQNGTLCSLSLHFPPSHILRNSERNLSFVLQNLNYNRKEVVINARGLTGPVGIFTIEVEVQIPEKECEKVVPPQLNDEDEEDREDNDPPCLSEFEWVEHGNLPTTSVIISMEMRQGILANFPNWTEADGLQILTTP